MALIELNNVSKTYSVGKDLQVRALKPTSLTIEQGEFISIMGASGSGKSTLLAILGLLDRSDTGSYHLVGKEVVKLGDQEYAYLRSQYLGFIFQTFNLLPRFNVVENASLPFLYADASKQDHQRVVELLKKVGLGDRLRHRSNEISGGQQQRVAIARALSNQPLIIFADEPTGNLDSKSAQEIMEILKQLNSQGTTVVMVTHEPDLAQFADRTLTLKDGEIVSDYRKEKNEIKAIRELPKPRQKRKGFSLGSIWNYSVEAYLSLLANKLRSLLSILGVLIGVAAVIAMLAIGTGARLQVQESLASMGSNLLMVSNSFRSAGISLGPDAVTRFSFEDLEALKTIDGVKYVTPYVSGRAQVVFQNKNWNTQVYGTSTDYQNTRNSFPENGRFFSENEITTKAKVAVIGKTVADQLFLNGNPLGQQIRINRINFTVIGVLPEKGMAGFRNQDDQILVPITTGMYRLLGKDYINNFDVQAEDAESLSSVQEQIVPMIAKLHRYSEQQSEGVEVRNMADMQKATTDIVSTFAVLLGSIAAISLLVGGIGIMNIMLVLVMERTHEIGLRKALGAENGDILLQFLVESVLICVLGGALGVLIGTSASWVISTFIGWYTVVSIKAIFLAFSFSVLVGLVFGIWPARRAAKMLPIEALRYE
jgi:macrolide transport system ATP-binding/permease protein